ncbi:MAG: UbiA family prenyltransferase [Phycisphaeraceae bacterium]|nr:UbiA family prenyltransferase [Phycisphaeraceae bacterium]
MNLRALLELCRISNLPTVWSNCVLGYFAGVITCYSYLETGSLKDTLSAAQVFRTFTNAPFSGAVLVLSLLIPFSLLYSGGMVLNDYLDREVDLQERPNRPIPSGRIHPKTALWLATGCLGAGLFGFAWFEWNYVWHEYQPWRATAFAAVLVTAIVMYNLTHQRSVRAVLLMGLCRGLIVLSAASVRQPPVFDNIWVFYVFWPAFTLIAYTVLISIVARREMETKRFAGPKTIMNMIAAMPLLDAVWLVVMGLWPASLFCVACAGMTKLAHRKVAGS